MTVSINWNQRDYKGISPDIKKYILSKNKKSAIILGLGPSLKDFNPDPSIYTIGVNDICRILTPDSVFIQDLLSFNVDYGNDNRNIRLEWMRKSNSEFLFSSMGYYNKEFENTKRIYVRGISIQSLKDMEKAINNNLFWNTATSVIGAISIAIMLGFKKLGFIGVDFTGKHIFGNIGEHYLSQIDKIKNLNKIFRLIRLFLHQRGISFYNLSKISKIYSIPKITMDQFID